MGYIPTEWQPGDVITAEKLNKAEQGIAAASAYPGVFSVSGTIDGEVITLNHTAQEIIDAIEAGCYIQEIDDQTVGESLDISFIPLSGVTYYNKYTFTFGGTEFVAASLSDYPAAGGES